MSENTPNVTGTWHSNENGELELSISKTGIETAEHLAIALGGAEPSMYL